MALQYKDVVSLAETGSSALVATIRQLGGSSVANFSDKELCSSFLNVYMRKNKPSALSKAELQKSTGLDINSILRRRVLREHIQQERLSLKKLCTQ